MERARLPPPDSWTNPGSQSLTDVAGHSLEPVLLHCDISVSQTYILDQKFGILFDFASTSFLVKGIIIGLIVIFIGFAAGTDTFTSHGVLVLAALVFR
jgi:hypothetical protein